MRRQSENGRQYCMTGRGTPAPPDQQPPTSLLTARAYEKENPTSERTKAAMPGGV